MELVIFRLAQDNLLEEDTQAFKEFCQAEDDKGIHRVNVVQEILDNTRIRIKLG